MRQLVADVGYEQVTRLSAEHAPPQPLPSVVHAARGATGAPTTWLHVPIEPATWHASHAPVQLESQQTPSATNPDVQLDALADAAPFGSLPMQLPALQKSVETQSASATQVVLHAVAPQTYGLHAVVDAEGQ